MDNYSTDEGRIKQSVGLLNRPEANESVKFILSSDEVERNIELFLRGLAYDPNEKAYVRVGVAKVGDEGIMEIMRNLKLRNSKIFTISQFDKQDVRNITKIYAINLIKEMYGLKRMYGMDKMTIRVIVHELVDSVYSSLKKAEGGNMQEFLTKTVQYHETHQVNNKGNTVIDNLKPQNVR